MVILEVTWLAGIPSKSPNSDVFINENANENLC